jgi:hypothetical protein
MVKKYFVNNLQSTGVIEDFSRFMKKRFYTFKPFIVFMKHSVFESIQAGETQ